MMRLSDGGCFVGGLLVVPTVAALLTGGGMAVGMIGAGEESWVTAFFVLCIFQIIPPFTIVLFGYIFLLQGLLRVRPAPGEKQCELCGCFLPDECPTNFCFSCVRTHFQRQTTTYDLMERYVRKQYRTDAETD